MEVKPLMYIKKPKYPLKEELNEEELKQRIPKRWMVSPAAKIAFGTLAAVTLTGCTYGGAPSVAYNVSETSIISDTYPAMINIAPLFEHGEGRGSYGCMMIAPPVFLSEEEALVVINEVAKEYGIEFSAEGSPEFTNVLQPAVNIYSPEDQALSNKTMSFEADFADSGRGVLIEFVSVEDVKKWHQDKGYASSVENYNTKNAADQLSDSLESAAVFGYTTGILYDPCERCKPEEFSNDEEWNQEEREAAWNKAEAKAREMSEEQLKAQAKDFFEWLKTQGVI